MISLRENLAKIGIGPGTPMSYKAFFSRPPSLRTAIASMDAPAQGDWQQITDTHRGEQNWTDEVQGVAWDGANWIFSADARQTKPRTNDKALYLFAGNSNLKDGGEFSRIDYKNVPHKVASVESDDHWGPPTFHDGRIYVAHFFTNGKPKLQGSMVVFDDVNGALSFREWIELESPDPARQVEFMGINPWDGRAYSSFADGSTHWFTHDLQTGELKGTFELEFPLSSLQGACFSPNGHLYVASNEKLPGNSKFQTIWYYSALNGHRMGVIPVLALDSDEELEGVAFGSVTFAGVGAAQIHTVLLENRAIDPDGIFFKSFGCSRPDLV